MITFVLWALGGVGALVLYTVLYEFARHRIRRAFARRWHRTLAADLREKGGSLDRFRFIAKQLVRLELLGDIEVCEAILEHARATGIPVAEAREKVEEYIDEIVPFFNLLSFYKVAYAVGRAILSFTYELAVDREGYERSTQLPKDASIVFVMNHRSNADFIIANTLFARGIAISFAVGEWARIWPLDALFRSFGSYFVRRGFREPLYHKILERYVQMVTRGGLSQGFFIEGGLSRDGRLRPPKIGILSYLLGTKRDPGFKRDILFVPVGIGFDRVVEDFRLLAEAKGSPEARRLHQRLGSLFVVIANLIRLPIVNLLRVLRGGWRRFGHAAISFGEPISADAWLASHPDLWTAPEATRKELLKGFAEHILERIGRRIPATPVPIVALSLREGPAANLAELTARVGALRKRIEASGAPVLLGTGFEALREIRHRLEDGEEWRPEIRDVDRIFLEVEENERIAEIGLEILLARRIVRKTRVGRIEPVMKRSEYLAYYANSIEHHLQGPSAS